MGRMRWETAGEERDAGSDQELLYTNGSTQAIDTDEPIALPAAGRLVWMTPNGALREIDPAGLETVDSTCPDCGAEVAVPTRAREHIACGHVGLDGFVAPDHGTACPKCGETDDEFPVVATVQSCLACGRAIGSPPR